MGLSGLHFLACTAARGAPSQHALRAGAAHSRRCSPPGTNSPRLALWFGSCRHVTSGRTRPRPQAAPDWGWGRSFLSLRLSQVAGIVRLHSRLSRAALAVSCHKTVSSITGLGGSA